MPQAAINSLIEIFPDEEVCRKHLETVRWNGIVRSPFSNDSKVYHCAGNKFKCRDTGKYFTVTTGTIFHNSKIPLQKWFIALWLVQYAGKPITSVELGRLLDITQKTAWFILRRLKKHGILFMDAKVPDEIEVVADLDKLKITDWLNLFRK